MENKMEEKNLLNLSLALAATPAITFANATGREQTVPALQAGGANGFALELQVVLPFDHLSNVLHTYLRGKRFELSEGFIKQHVIVDACKLYGNGKNLLVEVQFSGSFSGTVYCTGLPVYDEAMQIIKLKNFDYELKTNNFLLKGAKWLFDKIILDEIQKYTIIELSDYYKNATESIQSLLNKEWTKGVRAAGSVTTITITGIEVQPQQLLIRSRCSGSLQLTIAELVLKL